MKVFALWILAVGAITVIHAHADTVGNPIVNTMVNTGLGAGADVISNTLLALQNVPSDQRNRKDFSVRLEKHGVLGVCFLADDKGEAALPCPPLDIEVTQVPDAKKTLLVKTMQDGSFLFFAPDSAFYTLKPHSARLAIIGPAPKVRGGDRPTIRLKAAAIGNAAHIQR